MQGAALLALAFASGAAALVYETVWLRWFRLLFGSTAYAASAVLAAYFLGLALGAWLFAASAGRARRPLRVYAAIELGVAATALCVPWLLQLYDPLYAALRSPLRSGRRVPGAEVRARLQRAAAADAAARRHAAAAGRRLSARRQRARSPRRTPLRLEHAGRGSRLGARRTLAPGGDRRHRDLRRRAVSLARDRRVGAGARQPRRGRRLGVVRGRFWIRPPRCLAARARCALGLRHSRLRSAADARAGRGAAELGVLVRRGALGGAAGAGAGRIRRPRLAARRGARRLLADALAATALLLLLLPGLVFATTFGFRFTADGTLGNGLLAATLYGAAPLAAGGLVLPLTFELAAGARPGQRLGALLAVNTLGGIAGSLAARWFAPWNRGVHGDPRTRLLVEDGRIHVRATPQHYDVIVADLFVPWHPGAGSLYAREHFEAVRAHLAAGGVFAQWLPLYQLSRPDFEIVVATFLSVFPHATLWRGDFSAETPTAGLIALEGSPLPANALAQRLAWLRGRGIDDRWLTDPRAFWMLYVGPLDAGRPPFAGVTPTSDARPRLEFAAGRATPEARQHFARKLWPALAETLAAAAGRREPIYRDHPPEGPLAGAALRRPGRPGAEPTPALRVFKDRVAAVDAVAS